MARRRSRERTELADIAPAPLRANRVETKDPETLEEYRAAIRTSLRDLTAEAQWVQVLIDSQQRRMVDVDAAARDAVAAEIRADQAAQEARRRAEEETGHAWLRKDETAKNHGPTATPGNATALSLSEEITRTLHRIAIDLTDFDIDMTVPHLTSLRKVNQTSRRIRVLVAAANEPDRAALRRSHEALVELLKKIGELVHGHNQHSRVSADCPHCNLPTLVASWDDQVIHCAKTPDAEHYAPCVCSDPLCECKQRPIGFRHLWYGPSSSAGKTPSWYALRDRLNLTRAVTNPKKEPTR